MFWMLSVNVQHKYITFTTVHVTYVTCTFYSSTVQYLSFVIVHLHFIIMLLHCLLENASMKMGICKLNQYKYVGRKLQETYCIRYCSHVPDFNFVICTVKRREKLMVHSNTLSCHMCCTVYSVIRLTQL
jgi:hypothetical protein